MYSFLETLAPRSNSNQLVLELLLMTNFLLLIIITLTTDREVKVHQKNELNAQT